MDDRRWIVAAVVAVVLFALGAAVFGAVYRKPTSYAAKTPLVDPVVPLISRPPYQPLRMHEQGIVVDLAAPTPDDVLLHARTVMPIPDIAYDSTPVPSSHERHALKKSFVLVGSREHFGADKEPGVDLGEPMTDRAPDPRIEVVADHF